jgi:hypothetical protein
MVGRCTISLSIGRAREFVMPCFTYPPHYSILGYYIVTSGCPWPKATVKSPGFFKFGSCFSFFQKLLSFLFFYFYYYFV